ncbi:MAG TPA: FkbM family methyltransferase [Stellaceae bacterium]|nr:FkbM family methyltransferase [Stellaceae bacterium]
MSGASKSTSNMPAYLKRLYRLREDKRRGLPGFIYRRRKNTLLHKLSREWPGAYVLTDRNELAFIPAPLDARGQHLLFYGFDMPEPVLCFAPEGANVIDVGANLGEWSVPLAKAVGATGRVISCEPNPHIASALAATLHINNLSQAQVFQIAISATDGEGHLAIDTEDSGLSRLAETGVPVPLRSLDSIVANIGLKRLDLLKIDVEGHEASVFEGAVMTINKMRPALIFESGHEAPADRDHIGRSLNGMGYDVIAVLHHYGALPCTLADYCLARGPCAGSEARNLLALPTASGIATLSAANIFRPRRDTAMRLSGDRVGKTSRGRLPETRLLARR